MKKGEQRRQKKRRKKKGEKKRERRREKTQEGRIRKKEVERREGCGRVRREKGRCIGGKRGWSKKEERE